MYLKSFAHSVVSFLVVFSLLVPSVAPFLKCDNELIISLDISDEESKKEHKKELDKDVFFQDLIENPNLEEIISQKLFDNYGKSFTEVHQEIFLPPPEHKG
ncbi:hypothetical protein POV27_12300 [Aureisphaera galaxeae]|uniref:hypothetical protein n=1 Tax=Aureisphaera galaxeae TaxID=1538023 RepID=UPI00234FE708|nr:hypothetical protein [Aureisphaera galaxeae]MDC8004836.1 hypothetical protein [Aureisphaera galaxeae]